MSKRNKIQKLKTSKSRPAPLKTTPIKEGFIHFRFDHFDGDNSFFEDSIFDCDWAKKLLKRLKAFQRVLIGQFKTDMSFRQSQYVHEIKWDFANLHSFNIYQRRE